MLISCQRFIRNTYYKVRLRRANTSAVLFDALYKLNPSVFPWISALAPDRSIYLAVDFLSPQLQAYKGLEIAAFSPYHVACYWLPGVKTKACGFAAPGNYSVCLKLLSERRLTLINLEKTKENRLQLSQAPPLLDEKYIYLPCNLLHYQLFQSELDALVSHGLRSLHINNNL